MKTNFDVIIIGAGHAGVEAALACSRMGLEVLMATTKISRISYMSCNPSIGGVAKGNLVKEIDVLGGVMALAGDRACLQYKHLNSKKGPAVRGSRVQCDKRIYSLFIQKYIGRIKNITLLEEEIPALHFRQGQCAGVVRKDRSVIGAQAVILTTGTFMSAVMHVGDKKQSGGRVGDQATHGIPKQLKELGFQVTRLKTGTPPRICKKSINWSLVSPQTGDDFYRPLSFFSPSKPFLSPQLCHLTYTNEKTHQIIQDNLKFSPLFSGAIQGVGPRYCPSIEDKIIRFSEKKFHQIFLEPEEQYGNSIYVQGLSTSLPGEVQEKFLKTIKGLEQVRILQLGYAVEYDFINPVQMWPTLETKLFPGLYFAGQINGSSGYEEAAVQGLMAGINAAAKILGLDELILPRYTAYTGVLIDDLVTKGTQEPYRMLTSSAEHRLVLREDNVAERLLPITKKYRLLTEDKIKILDQLIEQRTSYKKKLSYLKWKSKELLSFLPVQENKTWTAHELLKRPDVSYRDLEKLNKDKIPQKIAEPVEIEIKYEGYIQRQNQIIQKNKKMGAMNLHSVKYKEVKGLSLEAMEKLEKVQPRNLDQAGRILGVSPAAIQALIIHVHGKRLIKRLQQ